MAGASRRTCGRRWAEAIQGIRQSGFEALFPAGIAVFLAVAAFDWALLKPYRISLSDGDVRFEARARGRFVAWEDLRSVSLEPTRHGLMLQWHSVNKRFKTSGDFANLYPMLRALEAHGPHVRIEI